jgi:D-alanyl-D-alanine carboxypeptidase
MEASSGHVLYERQADLRVPPASTTKIMTAVVALESDERPHALMPVKKSATRVPSSKLYLRPGQAMSVEDLLYSVLLSSANDASLVLAEGVAGSVERFTDLMTRKAQEIGARNTRFTNPHGLTAPGHYSTARDMAVLFNYAMDNPSFREIVQTRTATVKSVTSAQNRSRVRQISIRNHNRLLWNFEGALGGKTGYTYAAQKCFVGAASRSGVTLIVAIMGSRDLWGDTRRLLEYGFDHYGISEAAARGNGAPRSAAAAPDRRSRSPKPLLSWEEESPASTSSSGYVVQIASFRERSRAESLLRWIVDSGYQAYLEPAPAEGGEKFYRVRVGPYRQLGPAQDAARRIEKDTEHRPIVLPPAGEGAEEKRVDRPS